ncbi:hypothetical protein NHX12_012624 [Muraenolepis orangiensis]|uniref:Uncharacterized protein n=1 Tax=Muraenolepis orangiensis TaxID=630683 RepID=A0A9Q0I526_9TELE|nr:hypothetical protein NHX12_012624 [Muraenolepis orangiensis]
MAARVAAWRRVSRHGGMAARVAAPKRGRNMNVSPRGVAFPSPLNTVTAAESYGSPMGVLCAPGTNAHCNLSHERQKPDVVRRTTTLSTLDGFHFGALPRLKCLPLLFKLGPRLFPRTAEAAGAVVLPCERVRPCSPQTARVD